MNDHIDATYAFKPSLAFATAVLLCAAGAVYGGGERVEAERLIADRPGLGDGAWTIAPDVWLLELGTSLVDTGPQRIGESSALLRVGLADYELRLALPSPVFSIDGEDTQYTDFGLGIKLPLSETEHWSWALIAGISFPTGTDAVTNEELNGYATLAGETSFSKALDFTVNVGAAAPVGGGDSVFSFLPTLSLSVNEDVAVYGGYAGYYGESDQHWAEAGVTVAVGRDLQWDINAAYDVEHDVWFAGIGLAWRWR